MFGDEYDFFQPMLEAGASSADLDIFTQAAKPGLLEEDFSEYSLGSSMIFEDLFDASSKKNKTEMKNTKTVSLPQNEAKQPKRTNSSPTIDNKLLKDFDEHQLTTSNALLSYYSLPLSKSLKIPEGKRRHISAPFDDDFIKLCSDTTLIIHAHANGFVPKKFWDKNPNQTFGWCLVNFFQRKNNANSRFLHKLYNALILDTLYPQLSPYIGVSWLNKKIIKVNKHVFGRLIGVKTVDNSLFHQQGNFPSHGFVEISACDVNTISSDVNLEGVDFDNVRILYHVQGIFVKGCTESQISNFKIRK